jgi:hypothetical protein
MIQAVERIPARKSGNREHTGNERLKGTAPSET